MAEIEEVTTVSQTTTPARVTKTTKVVDPQIKEEHPQTKYETKKVIFRFYQIVWYILGVIETLLVFRIILKVMGANPASGFVNFVYVLSEPFARPFAGMFRTMVQGGSVFELSSIIGGFVYLVIAYALVALIQFIKPTSPGEVEENV